MHFSWFFLNFRVLWGVLRKSGLERYIKLSFMHVCKYLNQRIRGIREQNGKSFKGVSKTRKKKKHLKRLRSITQFKSEFLLLFTSCRKVLGKMPGYSIFSIESTPLVLFRWGTHPYMLLFSSVRPSVRDTPYLRNGTSRDHYFWYSCVK